MAPVTPSTTKLAIVAVGVWVSFVVSGRAQEKLLKYEYGPEKERFHYTSTLVFVQSAGNAIVALAILMWRKQFMGDKKPLTGNVPAPQWLLVALGYLGAHKFGMEALKYIIFPLQILVKSCKSIPVMMGERVFAGERHSPEKKLSVFLLIIGVLVFTLLQPKGKKAQEGLSDFHIDRKTLIGLGLVFLGLCCDGVYGPYQNKIAKKYDVSEFHLMFNMNMWQGLFAFIISLPSGEIISCLDFVARHPHVLLEMAYFCLATATGSLFIFTLQHDFGALTVTKVTTIRKIVSVLWSVVAEGHKMDPPQWAGVFIVFFSNQISTFLARQLGWSKPPAKEKNGEAAAAKGNTKAKKQE